MKLFGRELKGPTESFVVIPRPEVMEPLVGEDGKPVLDSGGNQRYEVKSGDVVFKAKAVIEYDEFNALVPPVSPVMRTIPGKGQELWLEEPNYVKKTKDRGILRSHWTILKSLAATPGLEWTTVDMQKPETWGNYEKELNESGFTDREIAKILDCVLEANGMSEQKYEEARKRFLLGQATAKK